MKKLLPLLLLSLLSIGMVQSATVTYNFENCYSLSACNLTAIGANAGVNNTYPTTFNGQRVLYFNGIRGGSPYPPYVLNFTNIVNNVTVLSYDVYPADASWAEFGIGIRYNTSNLLQSQTFLGLHNSDFTSTDYLTMFPDFDNTATTYVYCSRYVPAKWNHVDFVFNYSSKKLTYYLNHEKNCEYDWTNKVSNLSRLGRFVYLRSTTADTPNAYFDNITISNETTITGLKTYTIPPVTDGGKTSYDFNNCDYLNTCGLKEVGFGGGRGDSNITTFNSQKVLLVNGERLEISPFNNYYLQFLSVPLNTTIVEYSAYARDNSFSEIAFSFRANTTNVLTSSAYIEIQSSDSTNTGTMYLDIDGVAGNATCDMLVVGAWNKIRIELDTEQQVVKKYTNNVLDCQINYSAQSGSINNLGDYAYIRTFTGDTPNVFFDNITFYNDSYTPNTAPTILTTNPSTGVNLAYGGNQTYTVTVNDTENDTDRNWYINDSLVGTGLSYNAVANDLGTGSYNLAFIINDTEYSDNYEWNFTVNLNRIVSISAGHPTLGVNLRYGENQTYTVEVYDPDNDSVNHWTINGTTVANDTLLLNILANDLGTGSYLLTFHVSDEEYNDDYNWTFNVNMNRAPTIDARVPTTTDNEIYDDEGLAFNITATDPDEDLITYYWYLNDTELFLEVYPEWTFVGMDRGTGYFNITARITDGEFTTQTTWFLNVTTRPVIPEESGLYTADDLSRVTIDGLTKILIFFGSMAVIIGIVLLVSYNKGKLLKKIR